ncbi:MAG TPA: hypothetical protein VHY32_11150 [Caulobacteraceae bacterium]|jgi:hypothetical protein|nr:hypothetical protein [Caulobacteraceae bacterium]
MKRPDRSRTKIAVEADEEGAARRDAMRKRLNDIGAELALEMAEPAAEGRKARESLDIAGSRRPLVLRTNEPGLKRIH